MGVSLMDLAEGDSVVGVARAADLAEDDDDLAEGGTDPEGGDSPQAAAAPDPESRDGADPVAGQADHPGEGSAGADPLREPDADDDPHTASGDEVWGDGGGDR